MQQTANLRYGSESSNYNRSHDRKGLKRSDSRFQPFKLQENLKPEEELENLLSRQQQLRRSVMCQPLPYSARETSKKYLLDVLKSQMYGRSAFNEADNSFNLNLYLNEQALKSTAIPIPKVSNDSIKVSNRTLFECGIMPIQKFIDQTQKVLDLQKSRRINKRLKQLIRDSNRLHNMSEIPNRMYNDVSSVQFHENISRLSRDQSNTQLEKSHYTTKKSFKLIQQSNENIASIASSIFSSPKQSNLPTPKEEDSQQNKKPVVRQSSLLKYLIMKAIKPKVEKQKQVVYKTRNTQRIERIRKTHQDEIDTLERARSIQFVDQSIRTIGLVSPKLLKKFKLEISDISPQLPQPRTEEQPQTKNLKRNSSVQSRIFLPSIYNYSRLSDSPAIQKGSSRVVSPNNSDLMRVSPSFDQNKIEQELEMVKEAAVNQFKFQNSQQKMLKKCQKVLKRQDNLEYRCQSMISDIEIKIQDADRQKTVDQNTGDKLGELIDQVKIPILQQKRLDMLLKKQMTNWDNRARSKITSEDQRKKEHQLK